MTYKTNIPLIGTSYQKGVDNTHIGNGITQGQSVIQTTNATPTPLATFTVPSQTGLRISVFILALQNTGLKAAFASTTPNAQNNGTTTAAITTLPTITFAQSGLFAVTGSWSISGNNLVLTVTGLASTTINWVCSYEYFTSGV